MIDTNTNKTLIIDCDPGCDDALALLLAIRKGEYKKVIITTVAGNVPVERTTHNAYKIAALATHKLDNAPEIEIYRGSAISLMGTAPNVMSVHGRDGLGDVPIKLYPKEVRKEKADKYLQKESAVEFLRNLTSIEDGCDLVCTGPLTNIANALSLSAAPEKLLERFEKIVIMGGAFNHRGNITPTAEYNFFFDPIAVKVFLDNLKKCPEEEVLKRVVFVPLDVTEKAQLSWKEIDGKAFNDISKWTTCMLQKYLSFHAFGAQVIRKNCAFYECGHAKVSCCEFKDSNEYAKMWKALKTDRLMGKSGNKKLPRFSYLHDPLAVYFALNCDLEMTREALITIHTDDDNMRGSIIIHDNKVSMSSRDAFKKGTNVNYLSPELVPISYIAKFKQALLAACGFEIGTSVANKN